MLQGVSISEWVMEFPGYDVSYLMDCPLPDWLKPISAPPNMWKGMKYHKWYGQV